MLTVHALDRGRRVDLRLTLDAVRQGLALVDDAAPKAWIHVMSYGEWSGYYDYEADELVSFAFDDAVFDQAIANFEAQKNPIPLTYEHPDYQAASASGAPIPAAGWIHALEKRDDGLWAYVEFTARAAEYVRAGEYRYCSVVLFWEYVDRQSGEEIGAYLAEVGLVNRPFIDGLTPIQLSRTKQDPRAVARNRKVNLMATAAEKIASIRQAFQIDPALSDQEAAWAVSDLMHALIAYKKAEDILSAPLAFAARSARGLARAGGPAQFGAARTKITEALSLAMVDLDKVKEALASLPEQPTMEELVGMLEGLAEEPEPEVEIEVEEPESTEAADTETPAEEPESMRAAALEKLGLAEDATDEEMFAALVALMDKPEDEQPSAVAASAVQLAQAKVAASDRRAKDAEAVSLAATKAADAAKLELAQARHAHAKELAAFRVDLSIARGEIVPTGKFTRDKLVELASTSPETYDLVVSGLESVPTGVKTSSENARAPRATGATQRDVIEVARREVKLADPSLNRAAVNRKALELAKQRHPELFERAENHD